MIKNELLKKFLNIQILILFFGFSKTACSQKRGSEISALGIFYVQQFKLQENKNLVSNQKNICYGWAPLYFGNYFRWGGIRLSAGVALSINAFNSGFDLKTKYKIRSGISKDSMIIIGSSHIKVPLNRFKIEAGYTLQNRKINLGVFCGINGYLGKYRFTKFPKENAEVINALNGIRNELNRNRLYMTTGINLNGIFHKKTVDISSDSYRISISQPLFGVKSNFFFKRQTLIELSILFNINLFKYYSQKKVLQNFKL